MNGSLKDHVRIGSMDDVSNRLNSISEAVKKNAEWVLTNCERNEENVVLYNLLAAFLPYLNLMQMHLSGPIPLLGFCTRSAYELNVQTRRVLSSSADLQEWLGEAAGDQIEAIEALVSLSASDDPSRQALQEEVKRIKAIKTKHGFDSSNNKSESVFNIAKKVGLECEHRALYKLLSKITHPTSCLVNSGYLMNDEQTRNVMFIHAQIYVLDTLCRISDRLGVPKELLNI